MKAPAKVKSVTKRGGGSHRSSPTHIDLFAGPGGICTGFSAAGLRTVVAVEYIDSCVETYQANHPDVLVHAKDIREVSNADIKKSLAAQGLTSVDVVSGGFPCETFSTAGSKSRVYDDHRNFLYKEAIRIADAASAKILVLENVPAFVSKRVEKTGDIRIIDLLIKDLEEYGFIHHDFAVLNAADYGVPQNRQRFIMMASKTIPINKAMFNGDKVARRTTVEEALSDIPHIGPASETDVYSSRPKNIYQKLLRSWSEWGREKDERIPLSYHITPKHRVGTLERFSMISQGEGLKDLFDKLTPKQIKKFQEKRVLSKSWYIQRNQRLVPSSQSPTVTSHCLDELLHPHLDRALSVREAARLQSFPDWYDFKGGPILCPHIYKTQDKYEQIGDAVPPLLAKHVGKSIMRILDGNHQYGEKQPDRSERSAIEIPRVLRATATRT